MAAEQDDARMSDRGWSCAVLTLHHLRCQHDNEESLAGGIHSCRGHALSRYHQSLCQVARAVWRTQTEVRRPEIPGAPEVPHTQEIPRHQAVWFD